MKLFEIFGEIKIDDKNASQIIGDTDKKAEGLGKRLGGMAKTAGKWGLAIGAASTAVAGSLGAIATKAADSTDRIDKMSQKLGLSREGFQEWDYILSQNGASIDSMGAGMKTLTNQLDDLGKGGKVATDAFGELGLSYDDLAGKSQEEVFEITIQALQGMEDETKRAAIANDLLGRSGQELAPLLNAGADSVDELKKQAHDLGLVLEDDAIDAGVKFTDTVDNLKRAGEALFAQVGVELIPIFQDLADWIIAHMPQIREVAGKAFDVISAAVQWSWELFRDYLLPVFEEIFKWVQNNWPTISAIIKTAFTVIQTVWNTVLSPVLGFLWDALKKVVDFVSNNFPGFQSTIETVMSGVKSAVGFVVDIFDGLASSIDWALEKWNKWRNRPDDDKAKTSGSNFGVGGTYRDPGVNGRHARGLDYVPYDGYLAELHKGERVLSASEARNGQTMNHTGTIKIEGYNNQGEFDRTVQIVMDELRREVRLA